MTDLPTLIKKLEEAEEGSRELDCLIATYLTGIEWRDASSKDRPEFAIKKNMSRAERFFGPWFSSFILVGRYTTSIDAASALVEKKFPGDAWRLECGPLVGVGARTCEAELECNRAPADAKTPALALCLAFTRALQQREG